jgi:23S rRNA (adenine1618-N6)-methyltransferase
MPVTGVNLAMDRENKLHPRNLHTQKYNFEALAMDLPELTAFVKENKHGALGIDYSDANAVLCLNQALMLHHYKVKNWSIPKGHLCPPIPGRANYIHYIADLIAGAPDAEVPVGTNIKGLDIGTGTSCIYPILGNSIYGWKFVGTDISPEAINNAKEILNSNPTLKKNIKTRFQKSESHIFKELIKPDEKFDFTMCNPPFYSSLEEANDATEQKVKNLNISREKKGSVPIDKDRPSNFGGVKAELWCPGGETAFIKRMIKESATVKDQCKWFTTLVSNKAHLIEFYQLLQNLKRAEVRTIEMQQGKKISHLLAWRF